MINRVQEENAGGTNDYITEQTHIRTQGRERREKKAIEKE